MGPRNSYFWPYVTVGKSVKSLFGGRPACISPGVVSAWYSGWQQEGETSAQCSERHCGVSNNPP